MSKERPTSTIEKMAQAQHAALGVNYFAWDELDAGHQRIRIEAMRAAIEVMPDVILVEMPDGGRYRQELTDVKHSLLQELAGSEQTPDFRLARSNAP